ncbi:uncharacterized protein LOC143017719 isoform X2 [Oratosquilla oratoria]|uniref:uncharacterized protein LOC143017719 isoform X2 n=1 Tax=Oratosquilla oratoria TaxID=337810 RepID=UPI003F774EC7
MSVSNVQVKWSEESTQEFIQLRYKLRHLFNGKKHQCERAYSRIVDELGLTGMITAAQARKKWSNLLQKYMDIKAGCSTANEEWLHFRLLDQVVPLMKKEKIEKVLPPATVDFVMKTEAGTTKGSPTENLSLDADGIVPDENESRIESNPAEPPRKRGRHRKAAMRARNSWAGLEEEDDLPTEMNLNGGTTRTINTMSGLEPTLPEMQTLHMLESCSSVLGNIRDSIATHVETQARQMQTLQQTLESQGNTIKELLSTITNQNSMIVSLLMKLTNTAQPNIEVNYTNDQLGNEDQQLQQSV